MGPRLFLDTADTGAWERLLPTGIFHGVTTNPLLLERAHLACEVAVLADLARRAADLGAREIHLQTWGDDAAALEQTGLRIAEATTGGLTVLVKVPATAAGFRATARLRAAGLAVTLTAVYNAGQVLAAAAAGAAYAAPYLGRLDDAGRDGRKVVLAMQAVLRSTGTETRLLVASLRGPERVIELARLGLDTFTFGPEVADALLHDELTDAAAAAFAKSAQKK
ncbi:MAG: transaldolase [bacterium]|nr:transaldolase [bacterium]